MKQINTSEEWTKIDTLNDSSYFISNKNRLKRINNGNVTIFNISKKSTTPISDIIKLIDKLGLTLESEIISFDGERDIMYFLDLCDDNSKSPKSFEIRTF